MRIVTNLRAWAAATKVEGIVVNQEADQEVDLGVGQEVGLEADRTAIVKKVINNRIVFTKHNQRINIKKSYSQKAQLITS